MMHPLTRRVVAAPAAIGVVLVLAASSRASDGTGDSPWGPISAPADSTVAAPADARTPAWETAVNVPFWVIMFPLKLLSLGVEAGAEYLDESGALARARELYPVKIGNAELTGGLSAGGQDGLGANVNVDWHEFLETGNRMRLGFSAFTRGKGSATLGLKLHRTDRSWVELGSGYRNNTNARYYGIGPNSSESRHSRYLEELVWAGASYHRTMGSGFVWQAAATYSQAAALGTSDSGDHPHLSEEFADELPHGYRNRSDGFSFAFEVRHDDAVAPFPWGVAPERGRPERGGVRRLKASYFQEKGDGNSQFWTYRGELQQFLPLWFNRRALALRGVLTWQQLAGGDESIAFQRLITNDDPDLFRGYVDYRFRDRGLVLATAEYRWPLWSAGQRNGVGADAYVFGDWGQVFPELDDIRAADMTTSWGGGLRLAGFGFFQGRLELAWSEEDFVFRFRGDQVFQFDRTGLLNGRNPVPER